jgi:hypothetical protein
MGNGVQLGNDHVLGSASAIDGPWPVLGLNVEYACARKMRCRSRQMQSRQAVKIQNRNVLKRKILDELWQIHTQEI